MTIATKSKGVKKPMYVVMKVGWEYNDEIYHTNQNGSTGTPHTVFTSKTKAEKSCFLLNKKEILNTELRDYGYNVDELFAYSTRRESVATAEKLLEVRSLRDWFDDGGKVPITISDLRLKKFIKLLNAPFWEVVQVERG